MKPAHQPHTPSMLGRFLANASYLQALPPLRNAHALTLMQHIVPSPIASGLRIAYASDIHFGVFLDAARVHALAQKLNALKADILILGGDYGEDAANALRFWEIVPALEARYGVYAVLGNHDRAQSDVQPYAKAMQERGVTLLVNRAAQITIEGKRLAICATDDYNHGQPDFEATAAAVKGADFVIYTPHSPDALKDAFALSEKPFFHLALCGHTHGGQIRLFGFSPNTGSRHGWHYGMRHLSGQLREKGTDIIISNGIGTTMLPLRMGAVPQYHLITFQRTQNN